MPTILVVQHSLKLDNFQNGQIAVKCQALKTPSTNNSFFSSTVCQLFLALYTVRNRRVPFYSCLLQLEGIRSTPSPASKINLSHNPLTSNCTTETLKITSTSILHYKIYCKAALNKASTHEESWYKWSNISTI